MKPNKAIVGTCWFVAMLDTYSVILDGLLNGQRLLCLCLNAW